MKFVISSSLLLLAASSVFAGSPIVPTPEPATIGLLAAGLGGVVYVAWRRKGQK